MVNKKWQLIKQKIWGNKTTTENVQGRLAAPRDGWAIRHVADQHTVCYGLTSK